MFVSKLHAISVLASRAPSFHLSYTFSTAFSLKKKNRQSSEASAVSTKVILRQPGILLKRKTGRKLAEDVPLRWKLNRKQFYFKGTTMTTACQSCREKPKRSQLRQTAASFTTIWEVPQSLWRSQQNRMQRYWRQKNPNQTVQRRLTGGERQQRVAPVSEHQIKNLLHLKVKGCHIF